MITCPSTGQPCYHEVCNAGGWPCERNAMEKLDRAPAMPDPIAEPEPSLEPDETGPSFQIDDDEEPEF